MKYTKSIFMYMRGDDVLDVQNVLIELNYEWHFSHRKLEATGYFGFETVHFVRDFQNFFGLEPTGKFDYPTYQMADSKFYEMMSRMNKPKKPEPAWLNERKWW